MLALEFALAMADATKEMEKNGASPELYRLLWNASMIADELDSDYAHNRVADFIKEKGVPV